MAEKNKTSKLKTAVYSAIAVVVIVIAGLFADDVIDRRQ